MFIIGTSGTCRGERGIPLAAVGYHIPLPPTGNDYIALLPAVFRTVNDYGLTIDNRTYDCRALSPYRRPARLRSDDELGRLTPSGKAPRAIPFLDITRGHGRPAA